MGFCISLAVSHGQERGMKPIQIPVNGTPSTLYNKSYALLIGVSDYQTGWSQLPGVREDMATVQQALELNGFTVNLIMNPNSGQLYKAFTDFISLYGQDLDNRLLFFYAGHGYTLKTAYGEELGYIVPVDAPNPNYDPSGFQNKAMEMAQVEIYARRLQSKHALFLFDACFSGTLFSNTRAIPEIITYKTTMPVRQFITSGSADETVPDKSIFTQQFVSGIEGDADVDRNGFITGSELGEFLQTNVVNYTQNMQHPQYGKIRSPNLDKGDFVFPVSPEGLAAAGTVETSGAGNSDRSEKNLPEQRTVTTAATPPPVQPRQPFPAENVSPSRKTNETKKPAVESNELIPMVFVEGGTFLMGDQHKGPNTTPQHTVKLNDFYIGKYEVTRKQWKEVMGTDPSSFDPCEECPVDRVSWKDAQAFVDRLSQQTGKRYRLPTDAEWEFAARGGNKSTGLRYAGCQDPRTVSWMRSNADGRTHPVGQKWSNELGIYDMSGNVLEWCHDWYDPKYYRMKGTQVNPMGPVKGKNKVVRGGSYKYDPMMQTVTSRLDIGDESKYSDIGFRVVMEPD